MPRNTVNDIVDNFQHLRYNPTLALSYLTKMVEETSEPGYKFSNVNNPFVKALECMAVTTVGFNQEQHAYHRRLYPSVSQTMDDLYYHMSDKDMINAFAYPSEATFDIRYHLKEIEDNLIYDTSTGYERLVIPRDTQISVLGMHYTLQHPIEIRRMPHTGLQVVYLFTKESPIETLGSNYVQWSVETIGTIQMLKIQVRLRQFAIASVQNDVQQSQSFVMSATFDDEFFMARAHIQELVNGVSKWREIKTSYNPNIYDVNTPTVLFRILDKEFTASIPSIYTRQGLKGRIRIDLYTTKGVVFNDLSQVQSDDFSITYNSIDSTEINSYNTVIASFKTVLITSSSFATGGRKALTYQQLRDRVIGNSFGQKKLPITPNDISSDLEDMGYTVKLSVDSVTQRIFRASKGLSASTNAGILTAASATSKTLAASRDTVINAYGVYDNGMRSVLTDKCLYQIKSGILSILSTTEVNNLLSQSAFDIAQSVNKSNYYYSPFVYVMDYSSQIFDLRAYYMNSPEVISRSFVKENTSSGQSVFILSNHEFYRTTSGYELVVKIQGSDDVKAVMGTDVILQLSAFNTYSDVRSYLNAQYEGIDSNGDYKFVFYLGTRYDIDKANMIDLIGFNSSLSDSSLRVHLQHTFDLSVVVNNLPIPPTYVDNIGDVYTPIDRTIPRMSLVHESITLKMGSVMSALWKRAKSLHKDNTYLKHTVSVQKKYTEPVYRLFDGLPFKIVTTTDSSGNAVDELVSEVLHHKGDLVYDSDNNPVYEHLAGETILDDDGNPVLDPAHSNKIIRLMDLYLVEGQYYFVNEPVVVSYKNAFTKELVQWIDTDLALYQNRLLEQTKMYFYPKISTGPVEVYTEDGNIKTLDSAQSFIVRINVRNVTADNDALIKQIQKQSVLTISNYLMRSVTVSLSEMQSLLRDVYGDDVLDVQVKGAMFDSNGVITLVDETNRFSIKKKLSVAPDGKTYLLEDVDFSVVRH